MTANTTLNTVQMQVDQAETDLVDNQTNVLDMTDTTIQNNTDDMDALRMMVDMQLVTVDYGYENPAEILLTDAQT